MDRPGSGTFGDSSDLSASYPITFSALAGFGAATMGAGCGATGVVGFSTGCENAVFTPVDSFASFLGTDVGGDWVLRVSDNAGADVGSLSSWTANFDVTQSVPEPASLALVGLALLGAVAARRRKL